MLRERGRKSILLKSFTTAVLAVLLFSAVGQVSKGHKYYDAMQYTKAIQSYEKALAKEEDSLAIKRIAESYRRIHDLDNAEKYYKRASQLYPNDSEIQLHD